MNNREKWRERVRDIRAGDTTWWWLYVVLKSSYWCIYAIFNASDSSSFFFSWVLLKGDCPYVYLFGEMTAAELGFQKFSRSSKILFPYFFFQIFPRICNFPFLLALWFLLDFGCSFLRYSSFSTFRYEQGTFFYAKFHSYILAVYSYCLYMSIQFFFIYLFIHLEVNIILVHEMINHFSQFCKLVVPCALSKYGIEWDHCYYK